ncbi:hypothetical protein EDB85DRAFT_2145092 [Lactarius pseudohatsudake]|nr:hypothetical protein EDB85DRAFT_2145092 [Lactarius pseudohatsudake]
MSRRSVEAEKSQHFGLVSLTSALRGSEDSIGLGDYTLQLPLLYEDLRIWQLEELLKLATHRYETPYDALWDKTQSILTQIVAHHTHTSFSLQLDGQTFLDALQTHTTDNLHTAALEYGIILKDLTVIDREFKGEIASTMAKLTKRALQAQNIDRENSKRSSRKKVSSPSPASKPKPAPVSIFYPFSLWWFFSQESIAAVELQQDSS